MKELGLTNMHRRQQNKAKISERQESHEPKCKSRERMVPVPDGGTQVLAASGSSRELWMTWQVYVAPAGPGSALREEEMAKVPAKLCLRLENEAPETCPGAPPGSSRVHVTATFRG